MKKTARTAFVLMWLLVVVATGRGEQPLVYETIHEAAEKGNLDDIKRHLQKGAAVNARDKDGETPLMKAAFNGNLDVVKYLVKKEADVNAKNKLGLTPLICSVLNGKLDIVKYLVDKGADVNAVVIFSDCPTTLMLAAASGNLDVVKFIVDKGADVNAKDNVGWTPLKYATDKGKWDVVEFFKQHGAKE